MLFPLLLALLAGVQDTPPAPRTLQLVETAPVEARLEHADLPDAHEVWLQMIGGAKQSLDVAQFYVSSEPGKRMEPILVAIEAAVVRGVKVRLVADLKFVRTYPESLMRLETNGVDVLRIDYAKIGGGILHAKYMLVDGRDAYLGSQNFDWRSLEHIQELGARFDAPELVHALANVFEYDWEVGHGRAAPVLMQTGGTSGADGSRAASAAASVSGAAPVVFADGGAVEFVASPKEHLAGAAWDLPRIVGAIDAARSSVCVQLLTYKASSRDGGYWDELEGALRRAASRKVKVRLLLSDWCKRAGTIEGLQSLEVLSNVELKLVTLPPWSGGFVDYARTVHAKYLVVDGAVAWLGTSNWERDYFYQSRNVGLLLSGGALPPRLQAFFEEGWASEWAHALEACTKYEPPRISNEGAVKPAKPAGG
jgi:phosphatidylserine/phosphatidylglycerophosphate/cardiolipin synthase-like enzyme